MYILIAGIALLGSNSDMNEALSLSFRRDIVDIYSNSWGPYDRGCRVEGPGILMAQALKMGVREVYSHVRYCGYFFRVNIFVDDI